MSRSERDANEALARPTPRPQRFRTAPSRLERLADHGLAITLGLCIALLLIFGAG